MITQYLMHKDKSLIIYRESHWKTTTDEKYTSFDSGGIECEVGEFLYGLLRMMMPKKILETGTYCGLAASYMGCALRDNKYGKLTTIEFQPTFYKIAKERIKNFELEDYVDLLLINSKDYETTDKFDLIFLDTEPTIRFYELIKFYDNLNEGGFIFIHDLHYHMAQIQLPHGTPFGWPFGVIPKEIKELVQKDKLRSFHFRTPRGLTCFYKVGNLDYKWDDIETDNDNIETDNDNIETDNDNIETDNDNIETDNDIER